jgi:hypothetical protein
MSYKYSVLSDSPILFYRSNNASPRALQTYQDLIDNYSSYQDVPDIFADYNSVVTDIIIDQSGCNNNGEFINNLKRDLLPLVYGESYAMRIGNESFIEVYSDKDYYGVSSHSNFGNKYYSDNDFTLEGWFYFNIKSNNITSIYSDTNSQIGLFYDKGNLQFKVGSEDLTYTIPDLNKSFYIVATYNKNNISLYLDGVLEASKKLINFEFNNESIFLQCGPTNSQKDFFYVNSIAAYRYSLGQDKILSHYNNNINTPSIQIPDAAGGEIFEAFDNSISLQYSYSYPANKSWDNFLNQDLYYNQEENYIQILKNDSLNKIVTLYDAISIPAAYPIDSSKIEWHGDNGISIQTSTDNISWHLCKNGQSIPQYKFENFNSSKIIYIKIILESSDCSKYLPKLYSLSFKFYKDQIIYSENDLSTLTPTENSSLLLGNNKYSILSRNNKNGILCLNGNGFNLNTIKEIKSIEFFYTPLGSALNPANIAEISPTPPPIVDSESVDINGDPEPMYYSIVSLTDPSSNILVTNPDKTTVYSWDEFGTIYSSNILSIFVNGVDKTNETNILEVFNYKDLHHVVIIYDEPISDVISFNYFSSGGSNGLYQNISIYETAINPISHFDLYIAKNDITVAASNSTISITENSIFSYTNDWKIIENV